MFRLNFAPRLMLAMLFIVTLVAAPLFYMTRRSLQEAWQGVFEARFLSQLESLASMQKARLDSIGERCRELAQSDAVIRAVKSGEGAISPEVVSELLDRARVVQDSVESFEGGTQREGRTERESRTQGEGGTQRRRGQGPGPPDGPAGEGREEGTGQQAGTGAGVAEFTPGMLPPSRHETSETPDLTGSGRRVRPPWQGGSRGRFPWVRPDSLDLAVMDSSGRIQPVKLGPFPITQAADEQVQAVWQAKTNMTGVPATQEVTYMAFGPAEGERGPRPELREVIITPVTDPATLEVIGGLVVGLPVSTYGESALYDLNQRDKPGELQTGLWIEDRLFSRSIPRDVWKTVSAEIRSHLKKQVGEREEITVKINGVPHQMLYRCLNPDSPGPRSWQITLYSQAGLMDQLNALGGRIVGFALLAFGAAVLVSWLLSRRLVLPVRDLVSGTQRIKEGQYDTRVPVTTRDELATLAVSFNEMAEGLKQRQRYRDILFQVSDDDIARQLIETACLGGERREISVLFCDIREFTATTSGMAPEGVIDLLNEHMTALTEIVHRHHGVVDKFVGDLIMAIFGAPKSYGDDAGNAAACALEMVARREALNQTTAHPPLLMGIGIASGAAVAGCMGSENRLNYTVLGEPVNLASRLCSAAGPREVILDPNTCALLGVRAQGHRLRALSLKGFPHPVEPFLLTGLGSEATETGMVEPTAKVTAG